METTERQTIKPIGLARFLVSHRDCGEGFETLRDGRLITVFCQGCEASFSFLTDSAEGPSPDVDSALARLTTGDEPTPPDRDDQDDDVPEDVAPPAEPTPIWPEPVPERPTVGPGGVRYVSPPGPRAPGMAEPPSIRRRIASSPRGAPRRAISGLARRWRPIALAALGVAGAYVLIALTDGGDSFSSQVTGRADTAEPAVSDGEPAGNSTAPVRSFTAGGPGSSGLAAEETEFNVALPPGWGSGSGTDGRVLLGPTAGGAEIQVLAQGSGSSDTAELADAAAALLAQGLGGAEANRVPAQPVGGLIVVARAKSDNGSRAAYVAPAEPGGYLVIEHVRNDAPAKVKLQAQRVISSFEPGS
jgi:hypothetical protein